MGLNNYDFYKKEEVDKFTDRINSERATQAEQNLRKATEALPGTMSPMPGAENQQIGRMEVDLEVAHFVTMLTRDLGRQHDRPMKAMDVGTFTGHSAGAMARGMENGGTVITCDISDEYAPVGRQYWEEEGVADRVQLRIVPLDGGGNGGALKVLQDLAEDPAERGTYDIVFIDANKTGYKDYYEEALKLLRPGGKAVFDNMLWSGLVAKPEAHDANTDALRDLNEEISKDPRVDAVLLTMGDGIMIAEKRGYSRTVRAQGETEVPSRVR